MNLDIKAIVSTRIKYILLEFSHYFSRIFTFSLICISTNCYQLLLCIFIHICLLFGDYLSFLWISIFLLILPLCPQDYLDVIPTFDFKYANCFSFYLSTLCFYEITLIIMFFCSLYFLSYLIQINLLFTALLYKKGL